jgi:outer membrane protein TolC
VDFRQGVSPEDADVLAVVANPDLRAARAQRDLAAAQLLDAGLLPDPVLSYGQDVPVGGSDQGAAKASSTQVALDLGSLLTRGLRRSAARAEQQSMGARSHREGGRHPERHPAAAL